MKVSRQVIMQGLKQTFCIPLIYIKHGFRLPKNSQCSKVEYRLPFDGELRPFLLLLRPVYLPEGMLRSIARKKEAKLPVGAEEEDDDDFDWDEPITLRNPYDGMTEAFEDLEERISDLEDGYAKY